MAIMKGFVFGDKVGCHIEVVDIGISDRTGIVIVDLARNAGLDR